MRFVLMTEPQLGGSYDDLLFAARTAEQEGLEGFSRSDHFYWGRMPGLPATDAFATLAGLAREVQRIRLGVLVSPITFRHPAVIAKAAGSIDQMSGGRFDLGMGTGWMEVEHQAFGMPFPTWKERFERLEEALQYLRAAFAGNVFEGRYYRTDADIHPRPSGLRLIVGGSGPEKTPALAGRYADEYNHSLTAPNELAVKIDRMRQSAASSGRDPDSITVSVMGPSMLAADHRRLSQLMEKAAALRNIMVSELDERWTKAGVPRGTPDQFAEALAAFAAVGVAKYYLQWLDLSDREGIAEQVELAAKVGR
ncbi:MAG: LLM class flavin-dependent oxidoreductase [Acidimicrobiia bacterium]